MLTLHTIPSEPVVVSTVDAGPRLDVHNAAEFEATVETVAGDLGTVRIDATTTKHLDNEGLRVLTRLVESRRDGVVITIDAGPAVQVAALLQRNESLASAVLPLREEVAA